YSVTDRAQQPHGNRGARIGGDAEKRLAGSERKSYATRCIMLACRFDRTPVRSSLLMDDSSMTGSASGRFSYPQSEIHRTGCRRLPVTSETTGCSLRLRTPHGTSGK